MGHRQPTIEQKKGGDNVTSGQNLVKGLFQFGFGDHAGNLIRHFAVFKKNQGGNGLYAEFSRRHRIIIDIAFGKLHFIAIGFGQLIENWTDGLAGTAPGSPEINNGGLSFFTTSASKLLSSISTIPSAMMGNPFHICWDLRISTNIIIRPLIVNRSGVFPEAVGPGAHKWASHFRWAGVAIQRVGLQAAFPQQVLAALSLQLQACR